jgi:hypothetical protein
MKKMTDLLRRKPTIFLEGIPSFGTKFTGHGVKIASNFSVLIASNFSVLIASNFEG